MTTSTEALAAIAEWTKKGWRFSLITVRGGWECRVVGNGLANADCGAATFEGAVELALTLACAMEDDPQVIIERYRTMLETDLRAAFGKDVKFRIEVGDSSYGFDAKRIHLNILREMSPEECVRRETEFWKKGVDYPWELRKPVVISTRYPDEAEAGQKT